MLSHATRIEHAATSVRERFHADGWDDPLLGGIIELIGERAGRLADMW
ncbi:MAG: hypothetical protein ACRDKI_08640 [Solirubrobacterales bacterium]